MADRCVGPAPPHQRQGQRRAQHQHPADHVLGRPVARQAGAGHIADRAGGHGEQQPSVGALPATALRQRIAKHQRATDGGAGPEAGGGPLLERQRGDDGRRQRQHAGHDRRVHRVDFAQRQAQHQRKTDHDAAGAQQKHRHIRPGWPTRTAQQQVDGTQHRGQTGSSGYDEQRRQLRGIGRADGQARHRRRQREQADAQQAEPQATGLVAHAGWRGRGDGHDQV